MRADMQNAAHVTLVGRCVFKAPQHVCKRVRHVCSKREGKETRKCSECEGRKVPCSGVCAPARHAMEGRSKSVLRNAVHVVSYPSTKKR